MRSLLQAFPPIRSRLAAATLACVSAAGNAAPGEESLHRARALLLAGQADAAFALLAPEEATRAGEPPFDLLLGVAALESQRLIEAIIALERVLDLQPGNGEARAYLARAHFELGEDDTARSEFASLREDTELPAAVAQSIDRYLTIIEQRLDATRTRWNSWFESGLGWDSNVANATDADNIAVPAVGGVLILGDANRERSSMLWTFGGGTGFASPLAGGAWIIFGNASLLHRAAIEASDASQFTGSAQFGVARRMGENDLVRLAATAQRFDFGGERNRDLGGATVEWQHRLDARTEVIGYFQYALLSFPLQPIRNAHRYISGLGIGHAPGGRGSPVLFASVYGGVETAQQEGADFVGRRQMGARCGGEYTFDTRTVGFVSFDYAHSRHGADEPLFLATRDEHFYALSLGAQHPLIKGISLRPQVAWAKNDTNIPLFDFQRWEASLSLRSDF